MRTEYGTANDEAMKVKGLTPALTSTDISQRLSSFGTVKEVDGFDLLDGVGKPRKFGFVTIEMTPSKFTKCCNSLSGSTWKGAKLRIGEAKPDFRERIAAENAAAKRTAEQLEEDKRARKKRKLQKYGAVHATDMSLVTKENAYERPGWIVTPLGRIVRPIKMRPARPLADTDAKTDKGKEMEQEKAKKKTKTGKAAVRARRKTIDMLKYGSVHLKGVFVDVAVPDGYSAVKYDAPPAVLERVCSSDEDEDAMVTEAEAAEGGVEYEKDDEDSEDTSSDNTDHESEGVDHDDDSGSRNQPEDSSSKNKSPSTTATTNKLKELFAPQEEDVGFSLLGHLDLDLELDEDVPFPTTTEEPHPQPSQTTETIPITIPMSNRTVVTIQLDPKQPFFFPLPSSSTLTGPNKGKHKDLFDIAKAKGWNWRDTSVAFYRTETDDEIRKHWETSKVELTREWKRRWKETGKINRRKFGGAAPGDEW